MHVFTADPKQLIIENVVSKKDKRSKMKFVCLGTIDDRLQIYRDVEAKHPRALAPKRLPLNFTSGQFFLKRSH